MSQSSSAGADLTPDLWRLTHPERGTIAVAVGVPDALRTLDEGYPRRKKGTDKGSDKGRGRKDEVPEPSMAEDGRSGDAGSADDVLTTPGYVVFHDGDVLARAKQIGDHKISLDAEPPERGKFTSELSAFSGPRVQVRSSAFSTAVRQVTFRDGKQVVHFDPPPGSAAEARLDAIAASPWKRVAYPVAAGIGKSGWAIAMILLLPLLGRLLEPIIDWIAERVPDIEIPWPDVTLPSIPLPDITLPSIPWPDITLPEITVPGWVEFVLEYSKVWVPLVIGVALAVVAVRHSRRSRRIKQKWDAEHRRETSSEQRLEQGSERHEDRPDEA